MAIMRWDPFRELEQMERDMERLWGGQAWRRLPWRRTERGEMTEATAPALDMWETNDAVMLQTAMPGVRPEDLQVSVSDNTLTIRGEMKPRETKETDRYHRQEMMYGQYERVITLPPYAYTDQTEANYEHGILTLRFPKREQARAKQIQVKTNGSSQQGQQRTIEGRSETQQTPRSGEGQSQHK